MSFVCLPLPVVRVVPAAAPSAAALAAAGRFAPPPWDETSPEWQRIDQKLPADHLARRIDAAVDLLDLSALFAAYAGTGSRAHRPDLLLKVVLYEMQRKQPSPAQWDEDLLLHEGCQWLARGLRPSRSRLYAFRDRLGAVVDQLHDRLIGVAVATGLTSAQRAALDGSSVAANSSRHRMVNEQTLDKRLQALAAVLATESPASAAGETPVAGTPTAVASEPPASADETSGSKTSATRDTPAEPAARPAWMAPTLAGRQAQHERYLLAQQQLAVRLQQNQQRPASKRQKPSAVRISLGDPEAVLGLDKFKVYRPLYTMQLATDLDTPLVLSWELFAQASDAATLPPLLQRYLQATGRYPAALLSDAAYATALDLAVCDECKVTLYAPYQENDFSAAKQAGKEPRQIPKGAFTWQEQEQVYVCPQGHTLRYFNAEYETRKGGERLRMLSYRCDPAHCSVCPQQAQCTRSPQRGRMVKRSEHEHLVEALKQRMNSDEAKALYKLRCQVAERSFADAKEHRGLRRFSGRGQARARTEVGLVVLAHNALTVLDLRNQRQPTQNANPEEHEC